MSKKICRTCLKMTYKTHKTHESIHYPGETEQLKISDMLRYLVPELYLGVTVNPEICEGCKKTLRVAYAFRKQCMATENVIGCYLKKSRCTAASIELIDVILFWEQKRKEARLNNQNDTKAKEIISEWDDDASQDSEQSNLSIKEKTQIPPKKEKELTLCPELGVFVDKFGNYYDADGLSVSDPEAIINTDSDFLKITEVFSLTDEGEPVPKILKREPAPKIHKGEPAPKKQKGEPAPKIQKGEPAPKIQKGEPAPKVHKGEPAPKILNTASTEEQSTGSDKDKNVFRIRVIPEAKNSFEEPCISVIPEAKTDLIEARRRKVIKARKKRIYPHITAVEEAKKRKAEVIPISKPPVSNTPEDSKQPVAPFLPIIVDVRSECESVELCSPLLSSKSQSEKAEVTTEEKTVVKEEPMEHDSHDDEDTLTGSETNSNFDSIQGIIDNVPEDTYVDVPEFVHISNFSLKDLDELRKKQKPKQDEAASVSTLSPSSGNVFVAKKLLKLLPKSESGTAQATTSGGEIQEIASNSTQPELLVNKGIFKRHFKNCVVPKCPNNTDLNPQKIYVVFPKKQTRRLQWFKAIGIEPLASSEIYICEDHFDFSVDMENWEHFKVYGGIMRMKETVIPHSYLKEIIPHERIYKSQIDEIEKKRRAEQIERLEKIKIRKSCDSDGSVSIEYQGTVSATNGNKQSSVLDVQSKNDGDCPATQPALLNPSDCPSTQPPLLNTNETQLDQSLIDHVTEQAMEAYKNYHRTAQNCCYVNCTKTRKANPTLTFFHFPYLKSEIWNQWIVNCGNAYLASIAPENSKSKVLCERHFDKRDLIHAGGRTLLRTNAIPLPFDSPLCDVETGEDVQTIQRIDDKGDRKDEDGNIDLKCVERLSLSDDSTKEVYPLNPEKKRPRIIRKKGKGVKLVPVQPNIVERKNLSVRNDVCVLYTHYTTTGLYINDHDYLVTPYKRNKILINQNDEWLCMCFLCGSKHYVDDHVHHMNLHSSTCNVCKANLGTPFMLNMHVRYHTKKCKYCPEKVLYRDLVEHELLHAKEVAEFENFKEKMCGRIRKNLHTDEEPILISSQNGSEENFETSSSVELSEISAKQAQEVEKITDIPQEQEEPTQIIPESQQTDNLEDCNEMLLEKTESSADNTVGPVSTSNNIEESKVNLPQKTEPSADNTVGAVSTSINIEESNVILPQKTEPSADNTVATVPTMESNDSTEDYMKSSPDQPKNTPKKRNKKISIKTVLTSPNTNDERKARRKNRSREVEPVEIDERSPRILRSRQIKMVKEERLSPVPDNNSSC